MMTIQIGWPIATQPAVEHGSGQKSSFSTCWTWPLSAVTSFYLQVVWRKSHTEIFDSPLSERCWHGPGTSHDYPWQYGDHPQLLLTSEDRTHVTISIDLATIAWDGDIACSTRGVMWMVMFKCVKCDVALCVDQNCFVDYHTQNNL